MSTSAQNFIQEAQLSLGKADRTAIRSRPASDLQSRRERFFRGDTVLCTLC